jgi:hypothetical protein
MDVDMSNRFTTLRETADDAEEEESVSHSSSKRVTMSIPSRGLTMTPKSLVCVPFANND